MGRGLLIRLREEHGAVAVIAALLIVVLLGSVAFTIDLGRLRHTRQVLQNAVDFGSLAGAQNLPVQGAANAAIAESIARQVSIANAPELATLGLGVTFRCIVADANSDGVPDAGEVPFVCGPATGTWPSGWTTKPGKKITTHACNPYAGDKCNTIVVTASETVNYYFAQALGIDNGSTGLVTGAACKGGCGTAHVPLDVVLVLDRTGSMTDADIVNMKNAAQSILTFYDPTQQWLGLVALPYGRSTNKCVVNDPQTYPQSNYLNWQVVPITSNFSTLSTQINCLQRAGSPTVNVNGVNRTSNGHTNLGDPLDAARDMLRLQGRSTVADVIIFETDGQANQPYGMQPCNYLNTKANAAKAAGQTIYTIAYGLDNPPVRCTFDTAGPFRNAYATTNIASAATSSTDDVPGGCGANENKDGDNYFCIPSSADMEPVFRQVAAASLGSSHLVDI
jgi:putative Flp pilus-assembly TadE/G-like protein